MTRRRPTGTRHAARAIVVVATGVVGATGVVVATGVLGALGVRSGTAHAATAYRYWSYYVASGSSWQYSQRGPGFEHPVDGEVQGWRFAVQADAGGTLAPRSTPDFAKLCAATPAAQGDVRVGLVLDFGVASDAPAGEKPPAQLFSGCVRVPSGASGVDVLDAAVGASNVRIGNGLICGIDGYPKTECAVGVAAQPTKPGTAPTKSAAAPARSAGVPAKPAATSTKSAHLSAKPAATLAQSANLSTNPVATPTQSAASAPPAAVSGAPMSSGPASTTTAVTALPLASADTHPKSGGFPVGPVVGAALVAVLALGATLKAWAGRR